MKCSVVDKDHPLLDECGTRAKYTAPVKDAENIYNWLKRVCIHQNNRTGEEGEEE